ncbi:MAG: hypothetical protein F6K28_41215 [Microcoleus sp. SIO2G3]|nr:hypothetical protein [Microcoleus sp. SIO2G3]
MVISVFRGVLSGKWENAIAYSSNKALQEYRGLSPNEATSQTAFCQQCPKAQ